MVDRVRIRSSASRVFSVARMAAVVFTAVSLSLCAGLSAIAGCYRAVGRLDSDDPCGLEAGCPRVDGGDAAGDGLPEGDASRDALSDGPLSPGSDGGLDDAIVGDGGGAGDADAGASPG